MSRDYVPKTDAGKLEFLNTYASVLAAQPGAYGLAPADAARVREATDAYAAALAVAVAPATRTQPAVSVKNERRNAAIQLVRLYSMLIKPNAGISNEAKLALGIRPVNLSRTPVPAPMTAPALSVVAATQGAQTLRFTDAMNPRGGKPFGVKTLQLFVAITATPSGEPPADALERARFYAAVTRSPLAVAFKAADDGKLATYFGRWATGSGEVGPFGEPVSMRIAARGQVAA